MSDRFFILIILLAVIGCSDSAVNKTQAKKNSKNTIPEIKINASIPFQKVKEQYDSLIPIFDGLFITHNKLKWGVIDSTGKEIIPFKCDGIKRISTTHGIASVFVSSHSLNTGVPRYEYLGEYFFFSKNGGKQVKENTFKLRIEMESDFHKEEFIIMNGPYKYLPKLTDTIIQGHLIYL